MLRNKIMNLINDIEHQIPVSKWMIDETHIWPAIRTALAYGIWEQQAYKNARKIQQESISEKRNKEYHNNYELLNKKADAIFVNQSDTPMQNINGVMYDRLCDPLIDILHNNNKKTILLRDLYKYNNENSSFYSRGIDIKQNSDMINISGCNWSKISNEFILPELDYLNERLKSFIKINNYKDERGLYFHITKISNIWIIIRAWADYFKMILSRTQPYIGFIVCYYSLLGMGFNLACRECGIPSVDIQHGLVEGENDFHYSKWNNIPQDGYELLPSYFWCYDDKQVKVIEKWSNKLSQNHKAINGGDPWTYMYDKIESKVSEKYDKRISAIFSEDKKNKNILLTLRAGIELPYWVFEAIKKSPNNWKWWLRLHPRFSYEEKNRIAYLLQKYECVNAEYELATEIPLITWWKYIDVHVTELSSCLFNAQTNGIPSIIIDPIGSQYFKEQVESGYAINAYSSKELIDSIKYQINRKNLSKRIENKECKTRNAIDYLLRVEKKNLPNYINLTPKRNLDDKMALVWDQYLLSLFVEQRYETIINIHKKYESTATLYCAGKSYLQIGQKDKAIECLIHYVENVREHHSVSNDYSNLYSVNFLGEICCKIEKIFTNSKYEYKGIYIDKFKRRLKEDPFVYGSILKSYYYNKEYYKILDFKDRDSMESNFYIGRAYKDLDIDNEAIIYLEKFIQQINEEVYNRNSIVAPIEFFISANFHLGEIYFRRLEIEQARKLFESCIEFSQGEHVLANEYLNKLNCKKL